MKEGKGTFGYNAASGDYGDMLLRAPSPGTDAAIWSTIGFSIDALYGYRHSRLRGEAR